MTTVFVGGRVHYVDADCRDNLTVCGTKYIQADTTKGAAADCRRCLGTMCGDAIDYDDDECRREVLRSLGVSVKEDGYHYYI